MFRNLIPKLSDRFHLVAPDYPGFGQSSFPPPDEFDYTFERLYGGDRPVRRQHRPGPVLPLHPGLRRPDRAAPRPPQPERVQAIVTQSGNAYLEGFTP